MFLKTIKDAESAGWEWLARYNAPCVECGNGFDNQSLATYGKTTIGGKDLAYYCEDCGINQQYGGAGSDESSKFNSWIASASK